MFCAVSQLSLKSFEIDKENDSVFGSTQPVKKIK